MHRLWLVLIPLLAGCAGEPPASPQLHSSVEVFPRVSLSQAQYQLIYSGVQRVLSDPNSARFSDINAGRKPDGTLYVCGSVDTRNVSGNYTGNQPFFGTLDGRGFTPTTIGGSPEQQHSIRAYCAQQLALN
ncbi:MAG TPA: hypothetical protein VFQ31_05430 [Methyloceanibacter sp.]|nr:hypothetical protein [Methyloceanibacter sp.]